MRTPRKTDLRLRDNNKNNFSGIDISQGLDLEPPSLSPYFLLVSNKKKNRPDSRSRNRKPKDFYPQDH